MTSGIYGLFATDTQECLYVGLSTDIEKRWSKYHLPRLMNGSHRRPEFSEWFLEQSSPEDAVELRTLEICNDVTKLNELEAKWFRNLSPRFYGKEPSANEKWKYSVASSKKLSESLIRTHSGKAPLAAALTVVKL